MCSSQLSPIIVMTTSGRPFKSSNLPSVGGRNGSSLLRML